MSQKEPNIGIEEKKSNNFDNKAMTENLLIRVKNSIYRILNNSQYLEKKNFCEGTTVDTKSIFNEIKKFIQLNDYIIDEEIPIHWFLNYLLSNLNKLPHNYIENDYELLYDTIEKDLNDSDNYFNFDLINTMCEKIKYAKKQKSNYVSKKSSLRSRAQTFSNDSNLKAVSIASSVFRPRKPPDASIPAPQRSPSCPKRRMWISRSNPKISRSLSAAPAVPAVRVSIPLTPRCRSITNPPA